MLGCGTGIQVLNFISVCNENDNIFAVDTNKDALQRAERLAGASAYNPHKVPVTFIQQDANEFLGEQIKERQGKKDTYDHRKFDIILAANLIHYFDQDQVRKLLVQSKLSLSKDGKLYLFWFPENQVYNLRADVENILGTRIREEWNRSFAGANVIYKTYLERPPDARPSTQGFDKGQIQSTVYSHSTL